MKTRQAQVLAAPSLTDGDGAHPGEVFDQEVGLDAIRRHRAVDTRQPPKPRPSAGAAQIDPAGSGTYQVRCGAGPDRTRLGRNGAELLHLGEDVDDSPDLSNSAVDEADNEISL